MRTLFEIALVTALVTTWIIPVHEVIEYSDCGHVPTPVTIARPAAEGSRSPT